MMAATYEIRDAFTGETLGTADEHPGRREIVAAAQVSDTGAASLYRHAGPEQGDGWVFVEGWEDDGTPLR